MRQSGSLWEASGALEGTGQGSERKAEAVRKSLSNDVRTN